MHEFFHGWRRKAGVVTLVAACGLTGLWINSRTIRSETVFPVRSRLNVLYLFEGRVYWVGYDAGKGMPLRWGHRTGYRSGDWLEQFSVQDLEAMWMELDKDRRFGMQHWNFQPGYFVIPLTLLSAYLILWKPRKRT